VARKGGGGRRGAVVKRIEFTRRVPYRPEQMFALVADLEAYPNFLPNCTEMAVHTTPGGVKQARMAIAFGPIAQAYTSEVRLDDAAGTISASAADGPFRRLESRWRFTPEGEGTRVDFEVEYEFANRLISAVAEPAFAAKQEAIVEAFLSEAKRRYRGGG